MNRRFLKELARTLAAGSLAALWASPAAAQCTARGIPSSCTQGITLQFTALHAVRVTVAPTSFSFPVTPSDYNQGYTEALGHAVTVLANAPWTLSIRSTSATWTALGAGARAGKPRSDLQWDTAITGPYTPMTGTAVTIASGNPTNGTLVNVWYHILWAWNLDTPGTYTLPVVLLITAP